jgi:hypothetical protein
MEELDRLLQEIIVECEEDHVGLWSVVHGVHWELSEKDPIKVKQLTMKLVEGMLNHPGMAAGFPTDDGKGFTPWSLTKGEILSRVNHEWDIMGREPTLGEIVWFTITSAR